MRRGWRLLTLRLRAVMMATAAGGAATHLPVAAHAAVTSAEQQAWERARSAGTAEAFQRYLDAYPTGQFAEEAFRTIIEQAWSSGLRTAPAAGPGETGLSDFERAQVLAAARGLY